MSLGLETKTIRVSGIRGLFSVGVQARINMAQRYCHRPVPLGLTICITRSYNI